MAKFRYSHNGRNRYLIWDEEGESNEKSVNRNYVSEVKLLLGCSNTICDCENFLQLFIEFLYLCTQHLKPFYYYSKKFDTTLSFDSSSDEEYPPFF